MWMRAYGCLSLPGACALTFNFSYPPSPLSLFPSISLRIFPSDFPAHQSDSPEVEHNPSSEQRVFHVLGRHAGESAASSLFSLQTPASASQPYCLSLYLPPLFLTHCACVFANVYVLLHYGAHRFCRGRDQHCELVFRQHEHSTNAWESIHL